MDQSPHANNTISQSQAPQNHVSTPPPTNSPAHEIQTNPAPEPAKKSRKILKIFGLLGVGLLFLFGFLIFQGINNAPQVNAMVGEFMQSVSDGNLDTAYALTSSDFKLAVSRTNFDLAMITYGAQYSGYVEHKQHGFSVEAKAGQPTLYKYSGDVTYDDGDTGKIEAVFVKEEGEWKILSMKVIISPERLRKFQQTAQESVLGSSVTYEE